MSASLFLAHAATAHSDGTVSILRAWINQVSGPASPYALDCVAVMRVEGDAGLPRFRLTCEDGDGGVLVEASGQVEIQQGRATLWTMNVRVAFERLGNYAFVLRLDDIEAARWPVVVVATLNTGGTP